MQEYLGVKRVKAVSMNRAEYNEYRGWELPEDEDGSDEGYLVEHLDARQTNHTDHMSYISWCPKELFHAECQAADGMSFGFAIAALKEGHRVARKGWNGKGIFLELQVPDEHSKMTHPYIYIDTTGLQTDNPDAPKSLVPWLASQTDMLSNDWCIVN